MNPATAANVEGYLFEQGGWVAEQKLMDHFNMTDRCLRRRLEGVHIAGDKGYCHVTNATKAEMDACHKKQRDHAIAVLRNIKTARFNHRTRRIPPPYEPDADWPDPEPAPMPTVQPELPT